MSSQRQSDDKNTTKSVRWQKYNQDHLTELMMRPGKDGRNGREDGGTPKTLIVRLHWQIPLLLGEDRGAHRLDKLAAVAFLWFCRFRKGSQNWFCRFRKSSQNITLCFFRFTCPVQGSPCDVLHRSGVKSRTLCTANAWSGCRTFSKVKHGKNKIQQFNWWFWNPVAY